CYSESYRQKNAPPCFTIHFVECEVDMETGVITFPRVLIYGDCGTAFNPDLVKQAADKFGSDKICVAIDVALFEGCTDKWEVYTHGGTRKTGIDAVEWAKTCADNGAGSLLPTSVDTDGKQTGYDLGVTRAIKEATGLPVIASGGAGTLEHVYDALTAGKADAALVASMVHFNIHPIPEIKEYLRQRGIPVF
ncbi:MAG: molybdopterin-dependent oxidoreductase, partial [Abditibacteriota bacterium]|nr:molybdopterin-dependent oxidoreductase [Abditibacteriota bacterium]